MSILDAYVTSYPTSQNVLDVFAGEWSSALPASFGLKTLPGTAGLFEDGRVAWAEERLGGFSGRTVLELGPLEAGHSYMFQTRGAARVVAVEANSRAFMKCLCVKEVLNLDRVQFKLGDFMRFLEENTERFDIISASGVLYHMMEPIKLLELISRFTDRIYIWTHYYDEKIIAGNVKLSHKFEPLVTRDHEGHSYECSRQSYKEHLDWVGFSGGPKPTSVWLTRSSILDTLRHFGFSDIEVNFEQPDHPNGPAFAFCAQR
jgi:Protein of unknown function (DUF1698)